LNLSLTVGFLPWWPQNPYQALLKRELNQLGVRVIGNPPLSLIRIMIGRDGLDVVHVHWPHGTYRTWSQLIRVLAVLVAYRMLRNNIVWTIHELDAYESRHPRRDAWFRSMVMRMSRHLIVHGEHTRQELEHRHAYHRPVTMARHPSYLGWYKDDISRDEARQRLGLPAHARVFLYFGYIKPYKGVEDLIAAFADLNDDQALLLISGRPLDDEIKRTIEARAATDSRVRTCLSYIPDDDVQIHFRAADVVVFPFRNTHTSGSLMLALSFGKAVIVPRIATLPEYVDEQSGIFFDPTTTGGLALALRQAICSPLDVMGRHARRCALATDWAEMASTHLAVYERVAARGRFS